MADKQIPRTDALYRSTSDGPPVSINDLRDTLFYVEDLATGIREVCGKLLEMVDGSPEPSGVIRLIEMGAEKIINGVLDITPPHLRPIREDRRGAPWTN